MAISKTRLRKIEALAKAKSDRKKEDFSYGSWVRNGYKTPYDHLSDEQVQREFDRLMADPCPLVNKICKEFDDTKLLELYILITGGMKLKEAYNRLK